MKPSGMGLVPLRPQRTNSLTPSTLGRHFLVCEPGSGFSPDTEYILVLGFLSLQNCEKLTCSYNLLASQSIIAAQTEWQYTHTHTHTHTHTELKADWMREECLIQEWSSVGCLEAKKIDWFKDLLTAHWWWETWSVSIHTGPLNATHLTQNSRGVFPLHVIHTHYRPNTCVPRNSN